MSTLSYESSCPISVEPNKAAQTLLALFQLTADLNLVQTRLGTQREQVGDCELARNLGHTIRNKLQLLHMWESLDLVDLPPHLQSMKLDPLSGVETA
jgi:hypothetical protein